MSALALLGGDPVRTALFPGYRVIGDDERAAVNRVMDTGILSQFIGGWHPDFFGGPEVQAFEAEWAAAYGCAHAVSVNSATSGLFAAMGAAGVGPGDEVIVSPYTMSASAVAPLVYNAVPVFADIDPLTYTLCPDSIRARITKRTRAIIVVHIFGQAADMDAIMAIAAEHGLVVIEDCAQVPFATRHGKPVGTLGHMGVFSLNYHKHIHTGEGGVVTTNDPNFAERVQMIRNHAENAVIGKGVTDLTNLIGFNYRLGEIEAAIGRCQLRRGPDLIRQRQDNVAYLEAGLAGLSGLTMPHVPNANTHVYYVHVMRYDAAVTGVTRETLVKAIAAELPATELREQDGALIRFGYVKPLYLLPLFQQQQGYGALQCPFKCPHYDGVPTYGQGLCPNTEEAHRTVITHELMRPPMSRADLDAVLAAFHKVWDHLDDLRRLDDAAAA